MKRKIALVSALATLVTVGGVYATWTFSEGEVIEASTTVNVAMTGVTTTTEKGTLSVTVMNDGGFTLAVDDSDNNHKPDILKTGVITVTFTPSATASQDIKQNGIDVQVYFTYAPYTNGPATLDDWKYEETKIFDITTTESAPIHLDNEAATYENGVFTWTITKESVGIDLTADMKVISIDTYEKYLALNAELAKGHFVVTVSECAEDAHSS